MKYILSKPKFHHGDDVRPISSLLYKFHPQVTNVTHRAGTLLLAFEDDYSDRRTALLRPGMAGSCLGH